MNHSRKTPAKIAIQELLAASSMALSHAEIQDALNGMCNRVTIYRILDRLVEDGLVHKVVNSDGVLKFAGCHTCSTKQQHQHNHVHFSCQKCKAVTCLQEIEPVINLPEKYLVKEMNFTLSGLCPRCS